MTRISNLFGRLRRDPPSSGGPVRTGGPAPRAAAPPAQATETFQTAPATYRAGQQHADLERPRSTGGGQAARRSAAPVLERRDAPLRARLLDLGQPRFSSIQEAILADAKFGEAHPDVASAALDYISARAEPGNWQTLRDQAHRAGAHRLQKMLGPAGWETEGLLQNAGTHMRAVVAVSGGFVTASDGDTWSLRFWDRNGYGEWDEHAISPRAVEPAVICPFDSGFVVPDKSGVVHVFTQRGSSFERETIKDTAGASWVAACALGRGFVTVAADKTLRVWEKRGGAWHNEQLKGPKNALSVAKVGTSFAVTSADNNVMMYTNVGGKWKTEKLSGHRGAVQNVCALKDGRMVTTSTDKTVRVWRRDNGAWRSQPFAGHAAACCALTALGDGFVSASGREALYWREENGSWTGYPVDLGDPNEPAGMHATGLCPVEGGFVAVTNGLAKEKVKIFGAYMPWHLHEASPAPRNLQSALAANRLGIARQLVKDGARLSDDDFNKALIGRPDFAELDYEDGIEVRSAAGKTIVGAALALGNYAQAATHIMHGATVDAADVAHIRTQFSTPAALPAIAALLTRNVLQSNELPVDTMAQTSPSGATLVMCLCAMGHEDVALELLRQHPELPVFAPAPVRANGAALVARTELLRNETPSGGDELLMLKASRDAATLPAALQAKQAWRTAWDVALDGESGQDVGGLTKELLTLRVTHLMHPGQGLFAPLTHNEATLYFQPELGKALSDVDFDRLRTVGRLMGRALNEGVTTGVHLPHALWDTLAGRDPGTAGFAELEPSYAASVQIQGAQAYPDTFTVSGLKGEEVPLMPGGEAVEVTAQTRPLFVQAVANYIVHLRYQGPIVALGMGIRDALEPAALSHLTGAELDDVFAGKDVIDVREWKEASRVRLSANSTRTFSVEEIVQNVPERLFAEAHEAVTSLENTIKNLETTARPNDRGALSRARAALNAAQMHRDNIAADAQEGALGARLITRFWAAVEKLSPADQGRVLTEVTALPRTPGAGFGSLKQKFTVNIVPKESKLMAHTCFNSVDLPAVEDENSVENCVLALAASGPRKFNGE